MLKRSLILWFTLMFFSVLCRAQETVKKSHRLTDSVTEVFQVLKGDKNVRQGLYQALFKKRVAVAHGSYTNDKRTGLWHFYDRHGTVIQSYNYDNQKLYFEAPEDTTSALRYMVDQQLDTTTRVTKPIKIGGRYFGYIPYLQLFKLPDDLAELNRQAFIRATVELLISPFGRLADFKVKLMTEDGRPIQTISMNTNLPNPEDMTFFPATLNGEPISSRIIIKAFVTDDGHLDFDF